MTPLILRTYVDFSSHQLGTTNYSKEVELWKEMKISVTVSHLQSKDN